MDPLRLTLPWPPTTNTYYRRHGNVIHLSNRGRLYSEQVSRIVRKAKPVKLVIPVGLLIELWPPNRRKWDVDNRAKAVLDALTKARVWLDDALVRDLRIVDRGKVVKGGLCRVTIFEAR